MFDLTALCASLAAAPPSFPVPIRSRRRSRSVIPHASDLPDPPPARHRNFFVERRKGLYKAGSMENYDSILTKGVSMENYDSILTKEGSMDMEGSWPVVPATASGVVRSMECSQEIPTITEVKCSPEIHTGKKLYMGRRPEIDTTVVGPEIDTNILSEMGSGSIELTDWRNWAQIPHSALSLIFQKLGAVHVQLSAKAVCRSWRQVALKSDLSLWRCIDMRSLPLDTLFRIHQENLTMSAVHSSTLVEELHLMSASDDLLINIAHRTTGLRCWTLMCCLDVSPKVLINFLSRCPLLEELRLYICFFSHETFRDIGRTCSELKRLWVAAEPDSIEPHDSEYEYRLSKKSDKQGDNFSLEDMSSFCDSDLEASPRLHPDSDSDFEHHIDFDSYCNDICNSDQPKPTTYNYHSEDDAYLSEEDMGAYHLSEEEHMGAYHLSEEEDTPADHHSEEDWCADHHSKGKGIPADHRSKEDRRANHVTKEDMRAMEIASNMPQLRELHLIRNSRLTNKGLNAILDKCLQLESLEIYCCFNVRIDGALNAKLNRVKSVSISRRSYI